MKRVNEVLRHSIKTLAILIASGVFLFLAVIIVLYASLPRAVVARSSNLLSAAEVAGFDPQSRAVVAVTVGQKTFDIPRNVLAGMFVGPLYCPSGHGVCGKAYAPQLALLYPGMTPIPANRTNEFRVRSPARTPDLINAVMFGPAEPARAAAFLGGIKVGKLAKGPYGLYEFPHVPTILVAFPGTPKRLAIGIPDAANPETLQECNVQTYLYGSINFEFSFSRSLLPHWSDINDKLSRLVDSWARG